MARKYSNVSKTMTLTASVTITDTQIHVDDASGLPNTFPYVIVIDYEAPGVEICLVTAAAGNILTVTRGQEDTAAQPHTLGAIIVHAATAQDLQQAANHIEATTNVHGVGAGNAVVGTGTTQTLTNKTMSGASNTFSNIPGSAVVGPIAGTIAVANVVGNWPIDTRSTGNLPIDTRTTGDLPGSRLASPVTDLMTFNNTINALGGVSYGVLGTTGTTVGIWYRTVGADEFRGQISLDSTGYFTMDLLRNGTAVNRLRLGTDGNIRVELSGQPARQLPWAMYVGVGSIALSSAASGTVAITYPAGRFTSPPKVLVTTIGAANALDYNAGCTVASTTAGVTIGVRHVQGTAASTTVFFDHLSIQMTAGGSSGLLAEATSEHPRVALTCQTEGCGNAGIALVMHVPEDAPAMCGVCEQEIEDRRTL